MKTAEKFIYQEKLVETVHSFGSSTDVCVKYLGTEDITCFPVKPEELSKPPIENI